MCIPTFNGEQYLAEQLASILQSPRVDEVLLSDDGSHDRTKSVIATFQDARIRLLEGPRAGLVKNYEHLLSAARGEHIFLSDQDDVWLPDKVDVMMDALRTADLAVSDCRVVDCELQTLQTSFFGSRGSRPGLLHNLARNSYLGCCMAFHRSLLAYALPFPQSLPMHDWWLGLVAETFGTVSFIQRPLVLYRRHGGNVSATSERSTTSMRRQMVWRWRMANQLARRWWQRHGDSVRKRP